MNIISWALAIAAIVTLVVWMFMKSSVWIAITATLALCFLTSIGWLWWWIPIVAAGITIIGAVIAIIRSATLGRGVMVGLAVASLLIGLGAAGSAWGWFSTPAAADEVDTIKFDPTKDAIPEEAQCTSDALIDHSMRVVEAGNPEKKQFSTAVSIPLAGSDDKAVMSEVISEVCGNPTYLKMIVDDMSIWTDKDIPGANANKSWLTKINQTITDAPTGINAFIADKAKEDDPWKVTEQYQTYATWVNTVLLRSVAEEKQSPTSIRNWEISAAYDPTTGLPVAQLASEQENKPAWVRSFISKMGTCFLRFGFNAEDRRLEIFECEKPATPENPTPPTNPGNPGTPPSGCTENCGPTPTPTCPPDKPHGTWPICKDDSSRDPEQQGNNRPGGGGQAPEQTDPVGPPAGGTPAPTYTPPAPTQAPAPTVTPVDPGTNPVPTVAPSEQPTNHGHIPVDPSPTPAPGKTCSAIEIEFGTCVP